MRIMYEIDSMRKVMIVCLIGVCSILTTSCSSLLLPKELGVKSPVVWRNMSIDLPKGMVYLIDEDEDGFTYGYLKDPDSSMKIYSREIPNWLIDNYYNNARRDRAAQLETKRIVVNDMECVMISFYLDGLFHKVLFMIPKNYIFYYIGQERLYNTFFEIITDIKFLPEQACR